MACALTAFQHCDIGHGGVVVPYQLKVVVAKCLAFVIESLDPRKPTFRALNKTFVVYEVSVETIVARYFHKLLGDGICAVLLHKQVAVVVTRVAGVVKEQIGEYFHALSMRGIDRACWRKYDKAFVVGTTPVDELVDILPVSRIIAYEIIETLCRCLRAHLCRHRRQHNLPESALVGIGLHHFRGDYTLLQRYSRTVELHIAVRLRSPCLDITRHPATRIRLLRKHLARAESGQDES